MRYVNCIVPTIRFPLEKINTEIPRVERSRRVFDPGSGGATFNRFVRRQTVPFYANTTVFVRHETNAAMPRVLHVRYSSIHRRVVDRWHVSTVGLMCDVEMNLTRMLLNPVVYDKSIRPAVHHRNATNVSFDLSLAQLIDVDEKNQIITTNQWITMVGMFSRCHRLDEFRYRAGSIPNSHGIRSSGTISVYFTSDTIRFGCRISSCTMSVRRDHLSLSLSHA